MDGAAGQGRLRALDLRGPISSSAGRARWPAAHYDSLPAQPPGFPSTTLRALREMQQTDHRRAVEGQDRPTVRILLVSDGRLSSHESDRDGTARSRLRGLPQPDRAEVRVHRVVHGHHRRCLEVEDCGRRDGDPWIRRQLEELGIRKNRSVEALVSQAAVDRTTYEQHMDALDEEITLAEMRLEDARLDEIDLDGILNFARHLLKDVGRLWFEASTDQKQRLQQVIFPKRGSSTSTERFRTPEISLIFGIFPPPKARWKVRRPRRDLNPCCRRERPVSWARLDDGDVCAGAVRRYPCELCERRR